MAKPEIMFVAYEIFFDDMHIKFVTKSRRVINRWRERGHPKSDYARCYEEVELVSKTPVEPWIERKKANAKKRLRAAADRGVRKAPDRNRRP